MGVEVHLHALTSTVEGVNGQLQSSNALPAGKEHQMYTEQQAEWAPDLVSTLGKGKHLSQCKNWRSVTLLAVINKIFNKIVSERIKNSLEMVLRKEQVMY